MGRFESVGFRAMCGCPAHRDRAATNGRPAQVLPGGWVRSDVATRPIRPFNFDDMVRCYRSIVSFSAEEDPCAGERYYWGLLSPS